LGLQFFGLHLQAYHVGDVALYLLNVALLFFLLKRLLVPGGSPAVALWCAAIGALFWAVNPLRVETVAWASARIYCVAFCFAAVWLLAWLRAQDAAAPQAQRRIFYWLSLAAFSASLLTYPLAMFAPIA